MNDLIADLEQLGVKEKNLRKRDGLDYGILESRSIRIINRIQKHLKQENINIRDLFNGIIVVIKVKGLDAVADLEIVESEKFFGRLNERGLKNSADFYENICEFLCVDKDYVDYLRIDKLEKVLIEFQNNEFFREFGTVVSLSFNM